MKLTNRTTPQARNYQCDKCKAICCHKDMESDSLCYSCWGTEDVETEDEVKKNE